MNKPSTHISLPHFAVIYVTFKVLAMPHGNCSTLEEVLLITRQRPRSPDAYLVTEHHSVFKRRCEEHALFHFLYAHLALLVHQGGDPGWVPEVHSSAITGMLVPRD